MKTAGLQLRNPVGPRATIYVEYSANRKVKRVPTGVKVIASLFNGKTDTILKGGSTDSGKDTAHIQAERDRVNGILRDLHRTLQRDATVEELTTALEAQAAPVADTQTILPALNTYVAHKKLTKQPATAKSWATLVNNIRDYQREAKCVWEFGSISTADINGWQQWLLQRGYINSTIRKRLALLKQFLSDSADNYKLANLNLAKVKPLHGHLKVQPFTLSLADIEAIRSLELTSPRLERVRDLFVVQVFTGLRYSDLIRIQPSHIQRGYLQMTMQKTKGKTKIPLFPQALEILHKYRDEDGAGFQLPTISNQRQNDYLKELARMVPSLHQPRYIEYSQGTQTITKEVPAWELVTTHTARRSLITLLLDLGYPAHTVMEISGHRTYAAFSAYVGASQLDPKAAQSFTAVYEAARAKLSE